MSDETIGLIGVLVFLVLIFLGLPIAVGAILVGLGGIVVIMGSQTMPYVATALFENVATYSWVIFPLFVLMGGLASAAGLGQNVYNAGRHWVGHLPGGLLATTSLAGAAFGAVCGSGIAAIVTLGRIVAPEMKRLGQNPNMVGAAVASFGPLATMIPPSGAMVLYGILTGTSIAKLLIAGILPGILNAAIFVGIAVYIGKRHPSELPLLPKSTWRERFYSLPGLAGIAPIFGLIVIPLYLGWATPSEVASLGLLGALIVAIIYRTSRSAYLSELSAAIVFTARVGILLAGALYFSQFMALSRLPDSIVQLITDHDLSLPLFLFLITLMYILMGMFLEFMPCLIVTLPFVFPAVIAMDLDPVWFGVCLVLLTELAMITPPIGLGVFIATTVMPETSALGIFRRVTPFAVGFLITLLLLYIFPQIATCLPNLMD